MYFTGGKLEPPSKVVLTTFFLQCRYIDLSVFVFVISYPQIKNHWTLFNLTTNIKLTPTQDNYSTQVFTATCRITTEEGIEL